MEKVFASDQDAISYFDLIDISSSQTRNRASLHLHKSAFMSSQGRHKKPSSKYLSKNK